MAQEKIKIIKESIKKTEKAIALIEKILRSSVIKGNKIFYKKSVLTSGLLKKEIESLLLREDMANKKGIIISSGEQAVIPHNPGRGSIKPHQPIVCDIFPQSRKTGYFADITRTYVKGKPSFKLQKMYQAVKKAQKETIKAARPGAKASEIYKICAASLLKSGYDVGKRGFVHNAGHGVGRRMHQKPFLAKKSKDMLVAGDVITIEPGLYYPGVGGIRIEDMICVTKKGNKIISSCTNNWIIK